MPEHVWENYSGGYKGPVERRRRAKILVVAVDYCSKWPEMFLMEIISEIRVAEIFRRMFARLGIHRMVVSDNGKQFINKEVNVNFYKNRC